MSRIEKAEKAWGLVPVSQDSHWEVLLAERAQEYIDALKEDLEAAQEEQKDATAKYHDAFDKCHTIRAWWKMSLYATDAALVLIRNVLGSWDFKEQGGLISKDARIAVLEAERDDALADYEHAVKAYKTEIVELNVDIVALRHDLEVAEGWLAELKREKESK